MIGWLVVYGMAVGLGYLIGYARGATRTMVALERARVIARHEAVAQVMHCSTMHELRHPYMPRWEQVVRACEAPAEAARADGRPTVTVPTDDLVALCDLARDYAQVRTLAGYDS